MFDIITIGHLLRDVFLFVPSNLETSAVARENKFSFKSDVKYEMKDFVYDLGGTACNVAVGLSNLGFSSALVAKVGADNLGKQLIQELKQRKVSQDFIVTDHQRKTGSGLMLVSTDGAKVALVYSGASKNLTISDIPLTKLKSRWIYISSLSGDLKMVERIITSTKKRGSKVAYNPGREGLQLGLKSLLPVFRNLDLLIMNKIEAQQLAGFESDNVRVLFDSLIVTTPGIVIITDGDQGAYLSGDIEAGESIYFAPALRDKTVDTSGAGDAFAAGFLAGLLKYEDEFKALQLAIISASQVVKKMGAQAGLLKRWPHKNQLNKVRVSKL